MRGKKLEFIGMTLAWVILLTVIFVYGNLPLDHQIMLTVAATLSVYGSYQQLQREKGTRCLLSKMLPSKR
ncbi:MAG: hypothetical protein ACFB15_23250 [Cyclobacteriaceae bacterium]